MHLLGGQKGKPLRKVEAHLVSEYALGADAGAVVLYYAILADVPQKVQVLFHVFFTVIPSAAKESTSPRTPK